MFDLKTRALLHHTTSKKKEIYKRRIMVGDVLANKTFRSSNIDIFKANLNQSIKYKPEINVSSYTITSPTTITDYNEFDFWSQFILVDETTL